MNAKLSTKKLFIAIKPSCDNKDFIFTFDFNFEYALTKIKINAIITIPIKIMNKIPSNGEEKA